MAKEYGVRIQCADHPKFTGKNKPQRRYSKREVSRARNSWRGGTVHVERSTKRTYVDPCESCGILYELRNKELEIDAEDGSRLVMTPEEE